MLSSRLHDSFHLPSNLNLPGPISANGGTSEKSRSDICIPLLLGHSFPPCPPPLARFATRPMEHPSSRESFYGVLRMITEYLRTLACHGTSTVACAPQSAISRLSTPCLQINNLTATYRYNAYALPLFMFKSSSTNTCPAFGFETVLPPLPPPPGHWDVCAHSHTSHRSLHGRVGRRPIRI